MHSKGQVLFVTLLTHAGISPPRKGNVTTAAYVIDVTESQGLDFGQVTSAVVMSTFMSNAKRKDGLYVNI